MERTSVELQAFLRAASEFARAAGEVTLRFLGSARHWRKPDHTLVTEADHAAQEAITTAIAARYPEHAVLAEETLINPHTHASAAGAEYCWVIDPIDGTRNFARGIPCFCTSIALLRRSVPVVGVIFDPLLDRLYRASAGGGAWLADDRLLVHREQLDGPIIGVPSNHGRTTRPALREWLDHVKVRSEGAVALHLAYVAAGYFDGAYAFDCHVWDIAAGWLIVREAGGRVTAHDGSDLFPLDLITVDGNDLPFAAAAPELHPRMLTALADSLA